MKFQLPTIKCKMYTVIFGRSTGGNAKRKVLSPPLIKTQHGGGEDETGWVFQGRMGK